MIAKERRPGAVEAALRRVGVLAGAGARSGLGGVQAGGGAGWGRAVASLAGARPESFWTSQPGAPDPAPALTGAITADLAVIGGGFSGLWTALLARERDPSADVVLIEAATSGWAASGRNGGFCSASLTHGIGNGLARFPAEMPLLEKLGAQNLAEIGQTIAARGIDCDFSPVGELTVATQPWQLDDLHADTEAARHLGHDAADLDAAGVRRELDSPAFLGGAWYRDTCAMVDPARLARGLRRACLEAGVRLYENTRVRAITGDGAALSLATPYGGVRARQAVLATGAYPSLLRRIGLFFVPVYDYVLVTEPLSAAQLASLGWRHRQGAADAGNQFHYFRLTADNRVLWGGYDAVYFNGGRVSAAHDQRPETFARLAGHFFRTFPQLEDVSFEYAWGGAIDTCSRFFAFYGTAYARPSRLRLRAHRPRRRREPVRRQRRAGPAVRAAHRADRAGDGPFPPGAVPAGARPIGGHSAHPGVAGPGRPGRRRGGTCGSGHWTGSGWGSTPSQSRSVTLDFSAASREAAAGRSPVHETISSRHSAHRLAFRRADEGGDMSGTPLRERKAWQALLRHHEEIAGRHLRDLFAADPGRGERLTAEAGGLFLDYSKNRVTDETMRLLVELAEESRRDRAPRRDVPR